MHFIMQFMETGVHHHHEPYLREKITEREEHFNLFPGIYSIRGGWKRYNLLVGSNWNLVCHIKFSVGIKYFS